MTEAEKRQDVRVAAMTAYLRPHAMSLDALWAATPGAFLAAFGREVDKTNDHDTMLCMAALAPYGKEER